MDIALEICDTFAFDKFWATVLPAQNAVALQNASATFSSMREGATLIPKQSWVFQPSTSYFTLQPSEYAWMSQWPRDNIYRQFIELFLIVWTFGILLYFSCATLSYYFMFDHATMTHPRFLKNQVWLEIKQSQASMPGMSLLTALTFVAEVNGYAKLYDRVEDAPFPAYNYLQFPIFLLFTDCLIYWIHRYLHHPVVYKTLHKPHHKWIIPTPFASHAFHPLDGFAQSIPYHLFPFLFPLQKFAYIALFGFINIWTIFIHDGEYIADSPVINGAACHSLHHEKFSWNFGQFTTLWDRLGGTYKRPPPEMYQKERGAKQTESQKEAKELERLLQEIEGEDDRQYGSTEGKKVQ